MNELITACLKSKEVMPLVGFPQDLISSEEAEYLEWIFEYSRKYDSPPTIKRFRGKFPEFVPITEDEVRPLDDIREQTVNRKLRTYVLGILDEARSVISTDEIIPIETISEALRVTALTSGADLYTTFDRSTYEREPGLKLGLKFLDSATGGVGAGEVALVVGRLGIGKTMLLCWIVNNWRRMRKRILMVSTEMLTQDIFARLDAINGGFDSSLIRSSPERVMSLVGDVAVQVNTEGGEIIVPSSLMMTPLEISAMARHLNVDAVAIDGMYLLGEGRHFSSTWERVAATSRAVKQMARELKVPVIATSQIKRGEHGKLDDESIAYSDALGQDADFVVGISREEGDPSRFELNLLKNRFGPPTTSILRMDFSAGAVIDESGGLGKVERPVRQGLAW